MEPEHVVLHVYLAGASTRSLAARETVEAIADRLGAGCELVTIDVFEDPERAREAGVVVTPTVVRLLPEPEIRLSGNLSDEREVLAQLELRAGE